MARGAPDYQERVFSFEAIAPDDSIIHEQILDISPGGNRELHFPPVPPGHYARISHIAAFNAVSAVPQILLYLTSPAAITPLHVANTVPAWELAAWSGQVWADEGSYASAVITGSTPGDVSGAYLNGITTRKR